jgi:hypothetical protein
LFILWRSVSIQNFMIPRWLVQVLHPPQKFERPPFWNAWRYGIKKYGVEVTFNGMTSLLNFIKIYQLVQKLLGGTHRQTADLISLTFPFKESRLQKLVVGIKVLSISVQLIDQFVLQNQGPLNLCCSLNKQFPKNNRIKR